MKKEDAEEFTQTVGQHMAASFRQIELADTLGVPKALGFRRLRDWVTERLGGYVKLAVDARQKAVLELKAEGKSNRTVAEYLGVGEATVRRDSAAPNDAGSLFELSADQALAETTAPNDARRRTPPPPPGEYSVILADPPWQYDFSATDSRRIENQYETLDHAAICGLGKTTPFAANAVLFLWATAPKLREAFKVLDAWGFRYVTHAVWDKEIIGMGFWFRGQHELLLVATRGEFPPPPEDLRVASVIHGRRARHSEKPEAVYRLIESAYPELNESARLEMFAREPRPGWTPWGNEIE